MEIRSFEKIPACVGIIMDGNRRWERANSGKGLTEGNFEGHLVGYRKMEEVAGWLRGFGVKHLIAYALSTENLERKAEEVAALMDLCRFALKESIGKLAEEHIRVRIIGDKDKFPKDIRTLMWELERRLLEDGELWGDDAFELVLALGYGGRQEIERAAGWYAEQEIQSRDCGYIRKKFGFSQFLNTNSIPDPDLIIRTGGEVRLSNFLLYQAAYSELFFSPTLWPDFSYWELLKILAEFQMRHRRFGK